MTTLDKYIQGQEQRIEQSLAAINDLQRQLNDLKNQVRVEQQVSQVQKTANREITEWLKQGKKLFRDICSIYPQEALRDLANEVMEISDEVLLNYEEYHQSGRFLQGVEDEDEDENQAPVITNSQLSGETVEAEVTVLTPELPDEDDNIQLLSPEQIELLLTTRSTEVVEFIRQQFQISGRIKTLSTLSQKLAQSQLTRYSLERIITAAELTTGVTNGSKSAKQIVVVEE